MEFATKPDLALDLIRAAVAAGVNADYVTADEVYGSVAFRTACRAMGLGYVVAVPATRQHTTPDRRRRTCTDLVRLVPATAWARMRTGSATKGAKDYDWAMLAIEADDTPTTDDTTAQAGGTATDRPVGHSVLLMRRHRYTRKISYFRCWTPTPTSLADLVAVVCARWHIEEDFQLGKRTVGLDHGPGPHLGLLAPLVDRSADRLRLPRRRCPARTPHPEPGRGNQSWSRSAAPNCSTCSPRPFCPPRAETVTMSTAGRSGVADTKPPPATATEPGTPTPTKSHEHHELQLPWWTVWPDRAFNVVR